MTTQTGPLIQSAAPPGFANLALGQPSPRLLPMAAFAQACSQQLQASTDPLVMQYGVREGDPAFRNALAEFLGAAYGLDIDGGTVMAAGSISLSLYLACGLFGQRRHLVVSEDPTYFLARNIFQSSGMRVVGIPVDGDGMVVDALADLLACGVCPDFVYCIPSFHNPCSVTLSASRRRHLVDLADRYDFHIVADEPYNLLHFNGAAPAPMAHFDEGRNRVLSLGSFSKILGPGLRTGWIQASPALLQRVVDHGVISSGGALNPVITHIIGSMLQDGALAQHVDILRTTLRSRARALSTALRNQLPTLHFEAPNGGYFLWARLPEGLSATQLLGAARTKNLSFVAGPACAVSRQFDQHIRLSFAFYEAEELSAAVEILAEVVAGA